MTQKGRDFLSKKARKICTFQKKAVPLQRKCCDENVVTKFSLHVKY